MYDCCRLYSQPPAESCDGGDVVHVRPVVIREKISASELWDDIVRFDATLVPIISASCALSRQPPTHPTEELAHTAAGLFSLRQRPADGCVAAFKRRFQITDDHRVLTPRPKAMCRCSNFEGKEAPSPPLPWFLAGRFRPRSVLRCRATGDGRNAKASGRVLRPTSPARFIGKILKDPSKPGARSKAMRRRRE